MNCYFTFINKSCNETYETKYKNINMSGLKHFRNIINSIKKRNNWFDSSDKIIIKCNDNCCEYVYQYNCIYSLKNFDEYEHNECFYNNCKLCN